MLAQRQNKWKIFLNATVVLKLAGWSLTVCGFRTNNFYWGCIPSLLFIPSSKSFILLWSHDARYFEVNPIVPNAPCLYPLKTSQRLTVFWCFQGAEKGYIGNKWVNSKTNYLAIIAITIYQSLYQYVLTMHKKWSFPLRISSVNATGTFNHGTILRKYTNRSVY